MEVIEKKPVPIYETECYECHSKIQYRRSEVFHCQITCPVCGVDMFVYTTPPVKLEGECEEEHGRD